MAKSRYAVILEQKMEFYKSFTHEINVILKKLGLEWRRQFCCPIYQMAVTLMVVKGVRKYQTPRYFLFVAFNSIQNWRNPCREWQVDLIGHFLRDERNTEIAFRDMGVISPNMVVPILVNEEKESKVIEEIHMVHMGTADLAIVLRIIYHSTDSLLRSTS